MEFPSVVVFSNNCFSKTDSNGRTLGNLFLGWPKDKLAQFYLQNAQPDFSYCNRYYRVTDRQAMTALYSKCKGGVVCHQEDTLCRQSVTASSQKKPGRNALTMLLREIVWSLGCWKTKGFYQWLDDVCPEIVLLQAGDCAFLFHLAMEAARKYNAKLVIYNTEGYYFKNFDYFQGTGLAHFLYPLFSANLKRAIKKAYQVAEQAIFNCDALKEDFSKAIPMNAHVIYTATDFEKVAIGEEKPAGFTTTYAGNFGVGRAESLVEVANALQAVDKGLYLDLYGTIPNSQVQTMFDNCPGIYFHGRVSYEEVTKILQQSDLVIHVESFAEYFKEDSKYAFSTKIADCLATGTCFLVFAPEVFAQTRYLLDNEAAYVVTHRDDLEKTIAEIVNNPDSRMRYCANAEALVAQNHNKETAIGRFQEILRNVVCWCGDKA